MDFKHRKLALSGMIIMGLPMMAVSSAYAAEAVNLRHQPVSALQSIIAPGLGKSAAGIRETSRKVDFQNTLHIRVQETYSGYDVLGADAVMHIPNGGKSKTLTALSTHANASMNGTVYQKLDADLAGATPAIFTAAEAQKALQFVLQSYQQKQIGAAQISETESKLIVYVGKDNQAHWAYKVSFRSDVADSSVKPVKMVYVIDATSFETYLSWDDIKTLDNDKVVGGGFGGNKKMGKMIYDGMQTHLASLDIKRNASTNTCYLQNDDVIVKDYNGGKLMSFSCASKDPKHNNVYWAGEFDAVNDGYSPGDDALFGGQVIKRMYRDWYNRDVLVDENGEPMILTMVVHQRKYDNAYWDGRQMTFGDGYTMFYPLTSLGVAAHEISHGFTEQNSNLAYYGQSGGMNEAFSDMAAQAAEVYAYGVGKNSWQIGPEIFKAQNEALRYMDKPSKDCNGGKPGNWCSIDDASQYTEWLDVHYSSGVYNRLFYLMGTSEGWNAKKAFDVMVYANEHNWTSNTTFSEGACGILDATEKLGYDAKTVKAALDVVKVSYADCNK